MPESKTHFEQISVETVKKIANEFPAADEIESENGNDARQEDLTTEYRDWRELARRAEQERDPARLVVLVQKLNALLDEETRRKSSPGSERSNPTTPSR